MPADERSAFLDKACGADRALHAEVTALLLESESADSPVEGLVNEMIWPALESLSRDPSGLQDLLDDSPDADSDQVDPLVGKTVSHFEILAPIGRGGMGMVYRARDLTLDRTVALKFLPPSLSSDQQAKDRFIHEAKAASGLDHPNIATVHEIAETGDHQLFIAMGYYPGETLKEKIEKGPIAPEVAIDFAIQLASALDRVHRHGVIHRDIKPGNLMIADEGSVKLLDFGLAKLSYASGHTQVGQMIGTVAYMSPEQARGVEVDHRTDIWSMGVVLYEILTGKRPFDRGDAQSTIHAILEMDPEPPMVPEGEIPEPLKDVLGLCLAKDPDHRYQSAEDLLEDLQRADEGLAPKKRGGRATWNRRLRRRRQIVLGASAVVLAVGVLIIQFGLASDQVTFTRITEGAIVEDTGNFGGLAWGDYDGDGFIDAIGLNEAESTINNLYHNNGDGTFSRVTEGVIATDSLAALNAVWADQDNDGDLDLFVCTDFDSLDVFYRNEGDGVFTRVTEGDWVNTPGSGQNASWGDYDRDGFVDLYVANFGRIEPQTNFLYHNLGDGTMEAVTTEANSIRGPSHGCLWSDYDKDGDVDLFVGGQDKLQFRNDGDGVFTWIPPEKGGIPRSTEDVDVAFESADYDNDGDLDILYTTWKPDPSSLLYRNGRGIFFDDVTHTLPSGGSIRGMESAWGDYDNDGLQDLFIANRLGKNLLYHNEGSGSFTLITEISVVQEGRRSAGCAWVDYDNDGDLDLSVSNGMWSDFEQSCELYRNEGGTNSWIVLNLVGTVSNRSAIGAKVWAQATIDGNDMSQLREVRSGNDLRVHFGLGDATTIHSVRIEWPSGTIQKLQNISANQFLTITEPPDATPRVTSTPSSLGVAFTRITEGAIVEDTGNFGGLAWGDYDSDGYVDVVVADNGEGEFNHLYHNNGDGTFSRVTEGILVTDPASSFTLAWADQDNDGDLDLFAGTSHSSTDTFYRNEGDGVFTKVTEGDWVNTPGSANSVAWGDYDNDGFVDLYVANFGNPHPESNFLYHNLGDGSMEAVNSEANATADSSHGCLWSDYDDDGDLDLFVAQDKAQFRNDGDGTFTWIPPEDGGIPAITEDLGAGFTSANYDNDRDLDLLYTTWSTGPSSLLFRNDGWARFIDVTHVLPSEGSIRGFGSTWGDFDNDGHLDLFIANHIGKNLLFHNEGTGSFRRITDSPVVSEGHPSTTCAWADYDNDGDLDLIVANGLWSEFEESCELFRNDGGTNNWIHLKLVGTISNRSAIGAKIWARAVIDSQSMTQLREIHGGVDGLDLRVHFGLGDATTINSLRIEWPSGQVQEIRDVAANQFLTITEGTDL